MITDLFHAVAPASIGRLDTLVAIVIGKEIRFQFLGLGASLASHGKWVSGLAF